MINSTNTTFNNLRVYTYTQPNGFSDTLKSNYDYLPCTYSTVGCKLVRTYNNNNGVSDFSNYYDYTICMNSVNNANIDTTIQPGELCDDWSDGSKVLWISLILLIVLFVFIGVGFKIQSISIGLSIGLIFDLLLLIGFSIIGCVPGWVTVVIIIISAGIVALFFKNQLIQ
jgi:hypothetical protein